MSCLQRNVHEQQKTRNTTGFSSDTRIMLGYLSNYKSVVLNTAYVNTVRFTYEGKKWQDSSVVPTSPAESQFVLTPLSYFTGKKERKEMKILLTA